MPRAGQVGTGRCLSAHSCTWPPCKQAWITAALIVCTLTNAGQASTSILAPNEIVLEACEGQTIAILDLGDYAATHNFPACNYSQVVVNSGDGTVYLASAREQLKERAAGHELGSHAAPWYLMEAIKSSKYFTKDLKKASIVYVNDYCYYIWWLAKVHSEGRNIKETPGDYLLAGYRAMMETPKWQRKQGQDFVFYDSHPGFGAGNAARPVQQIKCFEIRKSTHLIMDVPMRYVCGGGWPYNKLMITPYNPNRLVASNPAAHLEKPFASLDERPLLAYHRSACAKLDTEPNNYNAGKVMRQHLAQIFANEAQDVQVKCTNHDHTTARGGAKGLPFKRMFEHMHKSVFCLVLPGDAASTRRLSEIMMAGCIPAFVGPPYHSMPFIQDVDYRNAAVFFNVSDYSWWLKDNMQTALDPKQKAMHETEARWWIPDGDVAGRTITVRSPADIIERLRSFPVTEASQKLGLMQNIRHYFSFDSKLTEPPNAVNVLMSGICKRAPQEPINT